MKALCLAVGFAAGLLLQTADVPASRAQAGALQTTAVAPSPTPGGQEGRRGEGQRLFGKISAMRPDAMEVTGPDGEKVWLKITSGTEFRKDRQSAKANDFKVGDMVMVRTDHSAADGAAATALVVAGAPAGGFTGRGARGEGRGPGGPGQEMMQGMMGKDYVLGEVKNVEAPKLTVLRLDNVTQTLQLNEETSLRRGRDSITMADIQPGDHIFARGAMANEVFVARGVNVIAAEQWQRMQEMMGQGGAQRSAPPAPSAQNPPERQN